jgi:hypothetical protein
MVTKDMEISTCMELIISIDAYSGNFLSVHANTSWQTMIHELFCSVLYVNYNQKVSLPIP